MVFNFCLEMLERGLLAQDDSYHVSDVDDAVIVHVTFERALCASMILLSLS